MEGNVTSSRGLGFRGYCGLFSDYFLQYLKMRISHRGDFLIGLLTSMAATIMALGFVLVLFRQIPHLANWKFEEVLFLYGFSLIPYGIFNILSVNLYEFGNEYIMEGKFDRVLIRPVSSLFQVLFENFRVESFQEIVTGLAVVIYASAKLHLTWGLLDIFLLIFYSACGGMIYISIFLFLSTVSFWFEDRIGVHPPAWNLLAFGRYPLTIYSAPIQFFLSWIIPFGFATFYPSVRLLHRPEFLRYSLLIPVVAVACLAVSIFAWNQGVRHYSSTGS
jgi:ABC-2 type transport system permease protein